MSRTIKRLVSTALALTMSVAMSPFPLLARDQVELAADSGSSSTSTTIASIGKTNYTDLESALAAAKSGDTVILQKDYTLTENTVIPAGVTLLVPYSTSDQGYNPLTGNSPDAQSSAIIMGNKGTLFRSLTIPSNLSLTVNGTLLNNALTGTTNGGWICGINGPYAQINLSGTITVSSGGLLVNNGLISGSGTIDAKPGSEIQDLFIIDDWRGLTQAYYMFENNVFPFNQYEMHNISATTVYEPGSRLVGNTKLGEFGEYFYWQFVVIDQKEGVIRPQNGTVTKSYSNGTEYYDFEGTGEFSSSSLNFLGEQMETGNYILPVNGILNLTISGNWALTCPIKVMQGGVITLENGTEMTIPQKGGLTDQFNPMPVVFYTNAFQDRVVNSDGFSTSYPTNRPDAKLVLEGGSKLTVEGALAGTVDVSSDATAANPAILQMDTGAKDTLTTQEANGYRGNGNHGSGLVYTLDWSLDFEDQKITDNTQYSAYYADNKLVVDPRGLDNIPAAPAVSAKKADNAAKNNGSFQISVTKGYSYQYQKVGAASWSNVPASGLVTGLEPGTYKVRVAEGTTWFAGNAATVTIGDIPYVAPKPPKPVTPDKPSTPDTKPDTKPDTDNSTKPDTKPDTDTTPKPDTDTNPKPDTKPDTDSNTKPDTKPDTDTKPKPDTTPDQKPDTTPKPDDDHSSSSGGSTGGSSSGSSSSPVTNSDGSTTTSNSDGSSTTNYPDGTSTTNYPDGSSTTNYPDGTTSSSSSDGSSTTNYPDGSTTQSSSTDQSNTQTTTYPNGDSRTITTSNNGNTIVTTNKQANGIDSVITEQMADGTLSSMSGEINISSQALSQNDYAGVDMPSIDADESGNEISFAINLPADGQNVILQLPVEASSIEPGSVAMLESGGSLIPIIQSIVKDGVMDIPLSVSGTIVIKNNEKNFLDVQTPVDAYPARGIAFLSARNLMTGVGDGQYFDLDGLVTRAQLATILYRYHYSPDTASLPLPYGVANGQYYTNAAKWAVSTRLMGVGSNFDAGNDLTREQLAMILWRLQGTPAAGQVDLSQYSDANQISSPEMVKAVSWAVETGLMGRGTTKLNAEGFSQRQELAAMLYRYFSQFMD